MAKKNPSEGKITPVGDNLLNEKDDIAWLFSTHLKGRAVLRNKTKSFIMSGNEDFPDTIVLMNKREPTVYDSGFALFAPNEDGEYKMRSPIRENPSKRKSRTAPSQITGRAPSARLKRRRAKPRVKGYFPNPSGIWENADSVMTSDVLKSKDRNYLVSEVSMRLNRNDVTGALSVAYQATRNLYPDALEGMLDRVAEMVVEDIREGFTKVKPLYFSKRARAMYRRNPAKMKRGARTVTFRGYTKWKSEARRAGAVKFLAEKSNYEGGQTVYAAYGVNGEDIGEFDTLYDVGVIRPPYSTKLKKHVSRMFFARRNPAQPPVQVLARQGDSGPWRNVARFMNAGAAKTYARALNAAQPGTAVRVMT